MAPRDGQGQGDEAMSKEDDARKARLAAALRANLKRRKAPGRAEEEGDRPSPPEAPPA